MNYFLLFKKKVKEELRKAKRFLLKQYPKPVDFSLFDGSVVHISRDKIEYIYELTSSTVFVLSLENGRKYFRECEMHTSPKKYLRDFTDYYFKFIAAEDSCCISDKDSLLDSLSHYYNRLKFFNLKKYIDLNDLYSPRFDSVIFENAGIDTHGDEKYKLRLRPYLMYSSTKVINYEFNDYLGSRNTYHSFFSNKSFAYREVAKLLQIEYLVPEVEYKYLSIENKTLFGFLMDQAAGINGESIPLNERKAKISPKLQRDFVNLSILDYLCEVRDHKTRNFNVIQDKNGIMIGISSFDNNEPDSFGFSTCLCVEDYRKCSCIIKDGKINRPYFDRNVATNVLRLSKKQMYSSLKNYLQSNQIKHVYERLRYLQQCIITTVNDCPDFLLSDDQWSNETVQEEFTGDFGKTYLVSFATELI